MMIVFFFPSLLFFSFSLCCRASTDGLGIQHHASSDSYSPSFLTFSTRLET